MASAATIRLQVESALARRYPSALTPPPRMVRPVVSSGVAPLDELLRGGLPVGALTELVGDTCSGRMSLALSFLSQITSSGKVCAWIPCGQQATHDETDWGTRPHTSLRTSAIRANGSSGAASELILLNDSASQVPEDIATFAILQTLQYPKPRTHRGHYARDGA
jgi:hypothetical protein